MLQCKCFQDTEEELKCSCIKVLYEVNFNLVLITLDQNEVMVTLVSITCVYLYIF